MALAVAPVVYLPGEVPLQGTARAAAEALVPWRYDDKTPMFFYTPTTRILSRRSGGSEKITAVRGSVTLI